MTYYVLIKFSTSSTFVIHVHKFPEAKLKIFRVKDVWFFFCIFFL